MSRSAIDSPPEEAPALDRNVLSQLIDMFGWEEAGQIWSDFGSDAAQLVDQIHEALTQKDPSKMAFATHTLKGTSQMFGAMQVAATCETLCRNARAGFLTNAEALVAELDVALPLAQAELAREFAPK